MKLGTWKMLSVLAVSGMLALAGCQTSQTTQAKAAPAPAPKAAPVAAPLPGTVSAAVAIPTGDKATSGLLIEKIAPAEVSVGQSFTYKLHVTNLTKVSLQDVVVSDKLPADYKLDSAEPRAEVAAGSLSWNLGTLAPGASKDITVTGSGSKVGSLENCVTGSYSLAACVVTTVTQPGLKLEKTITPSALKCDPIEAVLTVTNTGTGVSRNVKISDTLPQGLVTTDGKQTVEIAVGDLAPGAAKSYKVALKASKTGKLSSSATATADGGLKSDAADDVVVSAPVLTLTKAGTKKEFVGRQITYTLTVSNTGDGPAKNAMVSDGVPAGTTFVSASDGGTVENGTVNWKLGTLEVGKSKTLTLVVRGDAIGTVKNAAAASADCADAVTARAETEVAGIPAILLEVTDNPDPVLVGTETTYTITVTNQGSADGTAIVITSTLEGAQQYVSSTGPTAGAVKGNVITFAPLAKLAPKASVSWTVKVKALKAGDVRFSTSMNSDQLTRTVDETEATNQFE